MLQFVRKNYSINDNRTLYKYKAAHIFTLYISINVFFTSINMICLRVQSSLFNPIVKSIENKK